MTTPEKIEAILRRELGEAEVEIEDLSEQHRGHPGATGGGGHYRARIVSPAFAGRSSLQRHRLVYRALDEMMGGEIHALTMKTLTPEEA